MKRWIGLTLSLVFLALATGCPFMSKVPLAVPTQNSLDSRLVGQWIGADSDDDSLCITVLPFNTSEFYVELQEKTGSPSRYRLFAFDVGDRPFLHVNELSAGGPLTEYCFARYVFSGDSELTVTFVGEKIVPKDLAGDPRALLTFLKDHLNDPALDDKDTILALRRGE